MTGPGGRVAVATSADDGFAVGVAALGNSLAAHVPPGRELDLFVFDFGLSSSTRARLERSWPGSVLSLHFVDLVGGPPADHIPRRRRRPPAVYAPLLLAEALPAGLERVLSLDADMVVDADLAPLWDTDLQGHTVGAVRDTMIPYWRNNSFMPEVVGFGGDTPNFNAGLMLVDLVRWRRDRVGPRALEYAELHGDRFWGADQQALNCVLAGDWLELPLTWNRMSHVAWMPSAACAPFDADEFEQARRSPGIIHFAGSPKPWELGYHAGLEDVFFRYLDRTAWAGQRPTPSPAERLRDVTLSAPRDRVRFIRRGLRLSAEEGRSRRPWLLSGATVAARYPAGLVTLPMARLWNRATARWRDR